MGQPGMDHLGAGWRLFTLVACGLVACSFAAMSWGQVPPGGGPQLLDDIPLPHSEAPTILTNGGRSSDADRYRVYSPSQDPYARPWQVTGPYGRDTYSPNTGNDDQLHSLGTWPPVGQAARQQSFTDQLKSWLTLQPPRNGAGMTRLPRPVPAIREVDIESAHTGLGPGDRLQRTLRREDGSLDVGTAQALHALLERGALERPRLDNLGITKQWLAEHAATAIPATLSPTRQLWFSDAFADPALTQQLAFSGHILGVVGTDDYPDVSVKVVFENEETWILHSRSQSPFMLPWSVTRPEGTVETYDADLSRWLAARLPAGGPNLARLRGAALDQWLMMQLNTRMLWLSGLTLTQVPPIREVRVVVTQAGRRSETTLRAANGTLDRTRAETLLRHLIGPVEQLSLPEFGLSDQWVAGNAQASKMSADELARRLSLAAAAKKSDVHTEVTVTLESGERISAYSDSDAPFQVPWVTRPDRKPPIRSFDVGLARAIGPVLPDSANRDRLMGAGVEAWATQALAGLGQ